MAAASARSTPPPPPLHGSDRNPSCGLGQEMT